MVDALRFWGREFQSLGAAPEPPPSGSACLYDMIYPGSFPSSLWNNSWRSCVDNTSGCGQPSYHNRLHSGYGSLPGLSFPPDQIIRLISFVYLFRDAASLLVYRRWQIQFITRSLMAGAKFVSLFFKWLLFTKKSRDGRFISQKITRRR